MLSTRLVQDIPVEGPPRPVGKDLYTLSLLAQYNDILNQRVLFTQNQPNPPSETQLTKKSKLSQYLDLKPYEGMFKTPSTLPPRLETQRTKSKRNKLNQHLDWNPYEGIFKRQSTAVAVEACPSVSRWERITEGRTLNNTLVELLDSQWFWKTDCFNSGTSCRGFTGTRSQCLPKHSWVPAFAREKGTNNQYSWFYMAIASCCECAVRL
ncbi:uncharacterized protein LOC117101527 [Anneissia japonica]|uniref:uncharacterized protein LOC117101527 n=1 Tax=Anneissia japonica TaxID=1529436 RepID=UPI0014258C19|nr:uncharacterized protein LOC117101527 [Anneissia japonica]